MEINFAIIGGSGLYAMKNARFIERVEVPTPFGLPSDLISIVEISGEKIAFLPRHGRGHRLLPSEIPYRANIWALKSLGAKQILAVSAVGSLAEEYHPGDFVICDQLIDRTQGREKSFFGQGIVGHVAFADPYCPAMRESIIRVLQKHSSSLHASGTLVCMEGPLFSTRAESMLYRSWGARLIGMTALPEAKLAREAEICFSLIAMVTDYDCWKESEQSVTVDMVIKVMKENTRNIQLVIPEIITELEKKGSCRCSRAAENAIMTSTDLIPEQARRGLSLFYGKYWNKPHKL